MNLTIIQIWNKNFQATLEKLKNLDKDTSKQSKIVKKILSISNREVAFERERKKYEELIDAGYSFKVPKSFSKPTSSAATEPLNSGDLNYAIKADSVSNAQL